MHVSVVCPVTAPVVVGRRLLAVLTIALTSAVLLSGCGGAEPITATPDASSAAAAVSAAAPAQAADPAAVAPPAGTATDTAASAGADQPRPAATSEAAQPDFAPLSLNALAGRQPAAAASATESVSAAERERLIQSVIEKLQPLQVLLGQWRGTTRREYEGFKAVDAHAWVWDLQTTPEQPALVMQSDKSPYLRTARLTWDTARQQFALTATDATGSTRQYYGDFTEPVREEVGSDDKLHRVFRLALNQDEAALVGDSRPTEFWQIAFVQQENNRYLLEVGQRRGKADFRRYDTVSTQREGTSFALSDTDYAERTCIISEGLGTIEVSYRGRSYWVCCTGCKAAFEEDPEKWIARSAKRAAEKK